MMLLTQLSLYTNSYKNNYKNNYKNSLIVGAVGLFLATSSACTTTGANKNNGVDGKNTIVDEKKDNPFIQPKEEDPQNVAADKANAKAKETFAKAVELYQKKDLGGAKGLFREAAGQDDKLAIADYNQGVLAQYNGNIDEAVNFYRSALKKDPRTDGAVNNLGLILEAQNRLDDATALYQDSIEKDPQAVSARVRLAYLAYKENDRNEAVKLAREALQYDPQSLHAYRLLARVYAEDNKQQLARLIILQGKKIDADDVHLNYSLALVYLKDKKVAAAREMLREVLASDPKHIDARLLLVGMALDAKDWQGAITQLEALRQEDEKNAAIYNNLGVAYKGAGRFDDAKKAYLKAQELDANFADAALNLGILYMRNLNQPEEALTQLDRYMSTADRVSQKARALREECNQLIDARAEEKRQLELLKQQEEQEKQNQAAQPAPDAPANP